MLDLRRLRLLRELEARGTVHAVAAACAYSPSAVSQQLAVLEREAGVALLERAGRGVRLTPAGRRLAAHAADLLARAEAAEADLARASGRVAGTVRIASFQTAALHLVAPAVRTLRVAHPALRLEIAETEVEEGLRELVLGGLDVVVGDEYDTLPLPRPRGVVRATLLREEVRVVLPADHPLACVERVPMRALADEAWACGSPGTSQRVMTERACRSLGGFEPDLRHASNDLLVLLELVRTAGAACLLPDLVDADRDPSVAVRGLAEGRLGREVAVLHRAGTGGHPAVAAVLAALSAQAASFERQRSSPSQT